MTRKLYVDIGGIQVGRLTRDKHQTCNFLYDDQLTEENAVSVTMPVSHLSYTYHELHPIFAQNLPEGYLGDVIRKTVSKLYGADDLSLLAALGPCQIGRLAFRSPKFTYPQEEPTRDSIQALLTSDNSELFSELVEKYALRSGLSGVQPKVLLNATAQERMTLRTGGFIVKSWGDDYPFLAANEFFCMKVAQASGLKVPTFSLSNDGRLFVMNRFDTDDGKIYKGVEDGCVLQGLAPKEKYSGSYEKLAKSITTYVSTEHLNEALQQLFISLAASWAVQNGDAHLKNFAIIYDQPTKGRRLAPGFDIISTTAYLKNDKPALTLAGKKNWWALRFLVAFAQNHCSLKPRQIVDIFKQLEKALHEQTQSISNYLEHHPEFKTIGQPMRETFLISAKYLREYLEKI